MNRYLILYCFISIVFISCKTVTDPSGEIVNSGRTPVTITHIDIGMMEEVTELNATTTFLLKTPIKSTINGYILETSVRTGESVNKGEKLFVIRSKEAQHIGNTINAIDTTFHFKGNVVISSPSNGYITQINLMNGDYVQEGETIASISSKNSLVFLLEIPFELQPYISLNKSVEISLADGRHLQSTLSSSLPTVDPASQTQGYILNIPENFQLPENLIASVKFVKQRKNQTISLPKDAVLTNETQSEFWIMKAIDSTTAVKIPIKKGLETSDRVEIVSPVLNPQDKILLTGNYGLPDTAKVLIVNTSKQ
jgi:multidrug efflux pump subunit AcrA (membrane-fusion protein)